MTNSTPAQPLPPAALSRSLLRTALRWFLLLILLDILALGIWWGVSSVSHALTVHPQGKIVFDDGGNGKWQINTDGSEKEKIVVTPIPMPEGFSGYSAIWSPNKTHLAFVKLDKTNKNVIGLYVVDQGGNNEVLIMKGSVYHAQWSPDSMRIAFTVLLGPGTDKPRIYVTNADGSNQIQLTNSNSTDPAWSPDGKKIAFTGIKVVNLDGSGLTQLTTDSGWSPSWSPDGQYIVYVKGNPWCFLCPDTSQLWIMKADGSQQTFITNGPAHNPVWQPAP